MNFIMQIGRFLLVALVAAPMSIVSDLAAAEELPSIKGETWTGTMTV
jgi:hypothetical protein